MKKCLVFIYLLLCLSACKQKNTGESAETTTTDSLSSKTASFKQFGVSDKSRPKGLNVGDIAPQLNLTTSSGKKSA